MKIPIKTILLIVIIVILTLGASNSDRVMPALRGLKSALQGYEIAKTNKDAQVLNFDKRRAEIKPPEGAEATREAFETLGYTVTLRYID